MDHTTQDLPQRPPERAPAPARYLRVLLGTVGLGLGILAGFNYLVDPFNVYEPPWTAALEPFKDHDFRRVYIAEMIGRGPWETVFLGSSRAMISIDPRWPMWKTDLAFNAAVPAATMHEVSAIGRYALDHTPVKRMYVFTDFFSFNDAAGPILDFDRSRFNPETTLPGYHLRNLVSTDAVRKSIGVVQAWRAGAGAPANVRGFRIRTFPARYADQRAEIADSLNYYLRSPNTFRTQKDYHKSLGLLLDLARQCREKGVAMTVVVLPVHAVHLEAMRDAGMWPLFESWERDLAAGLESQAHAAGAEPAPFWDFTACRGAPAEPVPEKAGDAPAMRYFRDDAHPLPELGRLAMQRVMGRTDVTDPADGGMLGERLTTANVEDHLRRLREDHGAWAAGHAHDVAWVEGLAKAAADWNSAHRVEAP